MIIFIGGPPRVGKTVLAKKLAKKLRYSWLSTDDLRGAVKNSNILQKNNPLFIQIKEKETSPEEFYQKYSPKEIIKIQNNESRQVAKMVKGFIEEISYRNRNFIIEGVALLPSLYQKSFLKHYKIKFYCTGNTNYESFIKYSWTHRVEGDWLKDVNKKTFEKVIKYCSEFSQLFKKQAKSHNFQYFEINSENFSKDIEKTAAKLAKFRLY